MQNYSEACLTPLPFFFNVSLALLEWRIHHKADGLAAIDTAGCPDVLRQLFAMAVGETKKNAWRQTNKNAPAIELHSCPPAGELLYTRVYV